MQVQFKDTKFGRLMIGQVLVIETEMSRFGLARVDRLYNDPDPEKLEKELMFNEIYENGDTFYPTENLDTFESRIVKIAWVYYMKTREEWDEFVKFYKYYLLAQRIKSAGFPEGNHKLLKKIKGKLKKPSVSLVARTAK